jgi:hypothetical protein
MRLSTIIIGDVVKPRPRLTNCQTFNTQLTLTGQVPTAG